MRSIRLNPVFDFKPNSHPSYGLYPFIHDNLQHKHTCTLCSIVTLFKLSIKGNSHARPARTGRQSDVHVNTSTDTYKQIKGVCIIGSNFSVYRI